jgi:hypothetical protein
MVASTTSRPSAAPAMAQRLDHLQVALDTLLRSAQGQSDKQVGPIFTASLGPGLLFGGGWLVPA